MILEADPAGPWKILERGLELVLAAVGVLAGFGPLVEIGLGKFDCFVIQPVMVGEGIFKHEGDLMIYMTSSSTSAGTANISVYFEPGYSLDIAAVDVQNKVSMATPQLPAEVRQQGVIVDKQSPSIVCFIAVTGDERYDEGFLSNYVTINILDELRRIPGVGKAENLGEKKYSMRIWLDPDRIKSLGMSPNDVIAAVQSQNRQAALGRLGAPPTFDDQQIQFTLTTRGQLKDVKEFEDIIIKTQNMLVSPDTQSTVFGQTIPTDTRSREDHVGVGRPDFNGIDHFGDIDPISFREDTPFIQKGQGRGAIGVLDNFACLAFDGTV